MYIVSSFQSKMKKIVRNEIAIELACFPVETAKFIPSIPIFLNTPKVKLFGRINLNFQETFFYACVSYLFRGGKATTQISKFVRSSVT